MDNFFLDLDNFNKLPPVYCLNDIMLKLPLNFVLFSLGLIMVILCIFCSEICDCQNKFLHCKLQCTSWWGSFFFWSFVLICNKLATIRPIPKDVDVHEHHDLGSLYPIHLSFNTVERMFICTWTPWPWLVYIQSIYHSKLFRRCSHVNEHYDLG